MLDFEGGFIYHDAAGEQCDADEAGAVRVMERWDDLFGRDALSLIRRINTTHLAPDTGVIELTQEQTRMRYETLRQYPGESILDYKRRFNNALDAMIAVGLPPITNSSQAARFIINLDSKFGSFKADIANWAKNGLKPYPQSLEEAFESASTYREPSTATSTSVSGTAYVADAGRGRGRGHDRGRGDRGRGRGGRGRTSNQKEPNDGSISSSSHNIPGKCDKPCPVCQECHWLRYCPIVAAAKASMGDDNSAKTSNKVHLAFLELL